MGIALPNQKRVIIILLFTTIYNLDCDEKYVYLANKIVIRLTCNKLNLNSTFSVLLAIVPSSR